jgi:hypothetical protein
MIAAAALAGAIVTILLILVFKLLDQDLPKKNTEPEETLENAHPGDLIDRAPRADDLRARQDAIAESVRKRIRDRTRSVVSGDDGDRTPADR